MTKAMSSIISLMIIIALTATSTYTSRGTIEYGLSSAGHVLPCVYDVAGRFVRTRVDGNRPTGWHEAARAGGAMDNARTMD